MQKILTRISLFFSSVQPGELYLGFIVLLGMLLLLSYISTRLQPKSKSHCIDFISIPSFIAMLSLTFSILVLLTGQVNILIVLLSLGSAFAMSQAFLFFGSNPDANSFIVIDRNKILTEVKNKKIYLILFGFFILIYLFSVDHNYVPAQYDITTYQFIGDQLFRKGTYPLVPYAGSSELTLVPPPGFFIFDYLQRLLWNQPRAAVLVSILFLISTALAFTKLVSLFFKNKNIEPFVVLALFCRGLLWTYWEFNVLRELSLVCVLLFLICFIHFYREPSWKTSLKHLVFGQLFLSSAMVSHPENTAYLLGGLMFLMGGMWFNHLIRRRKDYIKKGIAFLVGCVLPLSLFAYWFQTVIAGSSKNYFVSQVAAPIPTLFSVVSQYSGIVPFFIFMVGCVLMWRQKEKRKVAGIFLFVIAFNFILTYFPLYLHWASPENNPLIEKEYNEFFAARKYVMTSLVHPTPVVLKITSFWWILIIFSAWFYHELWNRIRGRWRQIGLGIILGGLVFGDILYYYYNRPIVTPGEYQFLRALEEKAPSNTFLVSPPDIGFSYWAGPLAKKDSFPYRGGYHTANTLPIDFNNQIQTAYKNLNFTSVLNQSPRGKTIILLIE